MPHRRRAVDYGNLLLWCAALVQAGRYAGVFLAADVGVVSGFIAVALRYLSILSGLGMGILETVAVAYMLDALHRMASREARGIRWYGTLFFSVGLMVFSPVILDPWLLTGMKQSILVTTLEHTAEVLWPGSAVAVMFIDYFWATVVVMAPTFVIGGVAFARRGLVGVTYQHDETQRGGTASATGGEAAPERPGLYPRTCECGFVAAERFSWSGHFKAAHPANMRKKNPPAPPSLPPVPDEEF